MSVRPITLWQAVCNRCQKVAALENSFLLEQSAWSDRASALTSAEEGYGWETNGEDAWCPDCFDEDEETGDAIPKAVD